MPLQLAEHLRSLRSLMRGWPHSRVRREPLDEAVSISLSLIAVHEWGLEDAQGSPNLPDGAEFRT